MMNFLKAKINKTNILVAALAVLLAIGVLGGCARNRQPSEPGNETLPSVEPDTIPGPTGLEPSFTEAPGTEPPEIEPAVTEPAVTEQPATDPSAEEPPATEPPATEPPEEGPPATEPPATEPPAEEPPATEPPATEPPATNPAEEQPVTPQVSVYTCGVQGHICMNETYHESLLKFISDGCTHCGSSECPCLLAISDYGFTWPNYSECPNYNDHKDPTMYCQDCGQVRASFAKSGQECCVRTNKDAKCPCCGQTIPAGKCHHCVRP